ncbi:SlyX family protein [Azonexus sp.]|uniref:SlyX family protein n=1 Tax=Azonexus sp. TaxID=1872668 RepID=UPI0039E243B6
MEKRLTDLEIKISFAEEQIDALNKLIYQQQRQIEWLAGELQQLRSRAEAAPGAEWRSLRDEIPPHY